MTRFRHLLPVLLILASSLSGCQLLSEFTQREDDQLQDALQDYTSAKAASERQGDGAAQEKLAQARRAYEDQALAAASEHSEKGGWFAARALLDAALQQAPESHRLQDARAEIEGERLARLRLNDCRLGASRARYLADKARLLEARSALDSKDFMQDWLTRRERQELDQLAPQLRDCAIQALGEQRLDLAEDTLAAAAAARGDEFVAEEQRQLEELKHPTPAAKPQPTRRAVRAVEDGPQQKAQRARVALQSAMTRGDLRQAKAHLTELRQLGGDSQDLLELEQAINDAIAASIAEAHERANRLYRERQIVQARDLWQKILELDPEDIQARANLERAERVLKKLEELQGITGTEIPPEAPTPPMPEPTTGPAATTTVPAK